MGALYYLVKKELILLLRDWHALLLLFALPTLFILIMSLALRDRFVVHRASSLTYYLVNADTGPVSEALAKALKAESHFKFLDSSQPAAELLKQVQNDKAQFFVSIPKGFGKNVQAKQPLAVQVSVGPAVEPAVYLLFEGALRAAVTRVILQQSLAKLKKQLGTFADTKKAGLDFNFEAMDSLVLRSSLYDPGHPEILPTSVQQNVPAWLVFAMFFIALPLSTTWVQERSQGTFARLRSLGVPKFHLLFGKLIPYYLVNLLQVLLMLAVGVWLVPLCGGDKLNLGHATASLVLASLAVSFASVSWALLVANLVSTTEQATIFTGVSNLVLGAIGGVMVPRFIMPPLMQHMSSFSPMAWGLDAYLGVFLRDADLSQVAPHAAKLAAFALVSLGLAAYSLGKRWGK